MSEYPIQGKPTPFEDVYDAFWGKVTDDTMLEWTVQDTQNDLRNILMDSIPQFEFPRVPLYKWEFNEDGQECFSAHLTGEEINILAMYMLNAWLQRQITSIENTRQKFSGSIKFGPTTQRQVV